MPLFCFALPHLVRHTLARVRVLGVLPYACKSSKPARDACLCAHNTPELERSTRLVLGSNETTTSTRPYLLNHIFCHWRAQTNAIALPPGRQRI